MPLRLRRGLARWNKALEPCSRDNHHTEQLPIEQPVMSETPINVCAFEPFVKRLSLRDLASDRLLGRGPAFLGSKTEDQP